MWYVATSASCYNIAIAVTVLVWLAFDAVSFSNTEANAESTLTSCARGDTICLRPPSGRCGSDAAVQLQPIPYACGDQRALLPIAVGAMNINELMNLTTYATNASPPQYSHAPVS